ncbi:hypothetical protein KVM26_03465 [Helicobacter pylori]|nr:hypothetical protein KVM26_03465 [Helicobacter pylori]
MAFARFGEKKLRVLNNSVSNFLDHFHRLKRSTITIEGINTQDIQRQVSDVLKITNQYREVDFFDASGAVIGSVAAGVLATYGTYTGISTAAGGTVLSHIGGALAWMSGGAISLGGGLACWEYGIDWRGWGRTRACYFGGFECR